MHFEDPFDFFRFWLGWTVTIYVGIITVQSIWNWYVWLAGSDKYIAMVRRYLIVQSLRLRFRAFWGDVVISVLLCVAFLMIWHGQRIMDSIRPTLQETPFTYKSHARQ